MSTILKALRRLESERATPTDGRPLREAVAAAEPLSPAPERRRWAPLASLVVGVAVGATALLLWPRAEPSPPAELEVQPSELAASAPPSRGTGPAHAPRSAPLAPTPAREIAAPSPAGPPPQAFASEVAIVPRPVPSPRLVDPPPTELALAADASDQAPAPSGARAAPQPATGAPRATSPPPVVAQTPPDAEPTTRGRTAAPPPVLVDSPPDLQPGSVARADPKPERGPAVPEARAPEPAAERAVPPSEEPAPPTPSPKSEFASASGAPHGRTEPSKIRVEKTLWHPQAERRVAVVTLPGHEGPLRVREGEVVGEVLVSKIEPSGVVFTGERGDVRRAVGAR